MCWRQSSWPIMQPDPVARTASSVPTIRALQDLVDACHPRVTIIGSPVAGLPGGNPRPVQPNAKAIPFGSPSRLGPAGCPVAERARCRSDPNSSASEPTPRTGLHGSAARSRLSSAVCAPVSTAVSSSPTVVKASYPAPFRIYMNERALAHAPPNPASRLPSARCAPAGARKRNAPDVLDNRCGFRRHDVTSHQGHYNRQGSSDACWGVSSR